MPATRRCPQCGTAVRPDAPEGLCPQCLLKEALPGASEPGRGPGATATYSAGPVPPSREELARQFPQLEILELLGQGGMGIVYKARQPRLDRFVALKILPAQAARDPGFAERFVREARALARLTHPGIVTVYDFGENDGGFYLLMEFVDGVNLRHLLRERRLKPAEALQIVPRICEALQYAHEQGVVHRDIKPENILLDKKGHVKIADFGLAKLLGPKAADSALTGSQQVMGTPHYMAPEQMERPQAVDHRADIYSLGVVFYEMLTGELPLGWFAPPSRKVQVDVRLDEVVLRALDKEPERRYQHASEVKQEVETIRDSAPGSAGHRTGQEYGESSAASAENRRGRLRSSLGGTTGWVVVVCLLGVAGILQPFLPFAELQVLDVRGVGVPVAQVFGHESPFLMVVGLIFVSVPLVFIAAGVRDTVPLWRSVLIILAGVGGILVTGWAIWSSGLALVAVKPTNVSPSGSYNFVVMGKSLTVDYAVPKGEFHVSGKTTVVKLPEGKGPPGLTRVAIQSPVYLIIGLSFGLILLGTMHMRAGSILRHRGRTLAPMASQPGRPEATGNRPPAATDTECGQRERLALPLLPEDRTAAIRAYRERTGASQDKAKAVVEAMARKLLNPGARRTRWYWLALAGLLYGLSFVLPAVVVHGQLTSVKVNGRVVDDRPEPLPPMTLDGRSCFTWGLELTRPAWFANPVFWVGCFLFALRRWAWAGLLALVAVGLGLAEAAPDLCGYRPPGQGAEYLAGYWLWLASMAILAALGLVARLGGADYRDADPLAEGSTPAGRVS